ncbi:alpha/beta fold hydrolase [Oricola nitratireducens]|uniref:alpha/beta fold hydrolase n=1 Tax=Oricola nitratireducens TaxID=2775868 RepID=UPI0018678A60|nr:alpha/beta fold hydrolase [Oricola nitratireducens]
MELSHASFSNAQASPDAVAVQPAAPVTFEGLAGYFHAAAGKTAVLLLSPWGYEELCSRKTFRILGETLAAAGFPCLRFDYPGTGHSFGDSAAIDDDHAWRNGIRRALAELRALCNPARIVVMGQGIGGAFAGDLARDNEIDGLVLLAPVAQGRAYLRELAAWTAMTKPTFLVDASDGPEGGLMAGGFVLSAATANEFRALNLVKDWKPRTDKILLVERPDHPSDAKLADGLSANGLTPDRIPFAGYLDYISDPTLSIVPAGTVDRIVSWTAANFGPPQGARPAAAVSDLPSALKGENYEQTLLRFGPERMFFGALTTPAGKREKTAVLFVNSGQDHSAGWGRMTVDFARALAGDGFASLRMDMAGIGESLHWPGQTGQVLYSDRQLEDVKAAIDWLAGEGGAQKIMLFGRCSGAYLAFVAAVADPRIAGAFILNPRRLVWDPDEDVDKAIREPIQTLDTYRRKMVDRKQFARVLSGELSPAVAASKVLRAATRVADRKLAPVLRGFSKHHRLASVVHQRLRTLRDRGVPLTMVFSEGDRGVLELKTWFGDDFGGLSPYRNTELFFIADADHNLTPPAARAELLGRLRTFAARLA